MDIKPTSDQSISDDQELAKVLAGVNAQTNDQANADTQAATDSIPAPVEQPAAEPVAPEETPAPVDDTTSTMPTPDPAVAEPEQTTPVMPPELSGDLDTIKKEALGELRPLVDKLDVAPDEKFDTYLLLLRSTDDSSLIGPAHDAAKNIPDETRRAQALLDVIKEIDFLSNPQQ